MEKAKCFFCNKTLTEFEVRLLDRPYLKACMNCKNILRLKDFQSTEGKRKGVSRDGYYANR